VPVLTSANSVTNLPFTGDIPVTTSNASMTATTGNTAPTTSAFTTCTSVKSSSIKALAVAMARDWLCGWIDGRDWRGGDVDLSGYSTRRHSWVNIWA
jgi:hypothetical protein